MRLDGKVNESGDVVSGVHGLRFRAVVVYIVRL